MIRQSSSAGPCKYLHNQNKKLCKIFAKERRKKKKLRYSPKNIPIPSERSYKLQLMDKIDQVIKRMGWKAFFYTNRTEIRKKPMA